MNWLAMGLKLAAKIPIEKFLFKKRDPTAEEEVFFHRLEENWEKQHGSSSAIARQEVAASSPALRSPVTTEETIAYQRRELGKELVLLEKHLQQKCKIAGKPCDCCEKHPLIIEALAQETLGMTADPLFDETAQWAQRASPLTTEAASASGQYDDRYAQLAVEARRLRKRIMGTEDLNALLTPDQQTKVQEELAEILAEGGPNERSEEVRPDRRDLQDGNPETPEGARTATGE